LLSGEKGGELLMGTRLLPRTRNRLVPGLFLRRVAGKKRGDAAEVENVVRGELANAWNIADVDGGTFWNVACELSISLMGRHNALLYHHSLCYDSFTLPHEEFLRCTRKLRALRFLTRSVHFAFCIKLELERLAPFFVRMNPIRTASSPSNCFASICRPSGFISSSPSSKSSSPRI
jgi:hypothetical protein